MLVILLCIVLLLCIAHMNQAFYILDSDLCSYIKQPWPRSQVQVFPALSHEEVRHVLGEVEYLTNELGWSNSRHKNYPTVDVEIANNWSRATLRVVNRVVSECKKRIAWRFWVDPSKVMLKEAFVVKYSMDGQRELNFHQDGNEFSFIIGLNDQFTGGGTHVKATKTTYRLQVGEAMLFDAQSWHAGLPITSGTRYILTGFMYYKHPDFCESQDEEDLFNYEI
jgi:hypothetical protein